MDDKEIVKLGNKAARMYREAWKINIIIEDELMKRFGFKGVEDFVEKSGKDFENDVLIDSIQQGGGFTMKDWKNAIKMQKLYIERRY